MKDRITLEIELETLRKRKTRYNEAAIEEKSKIIALHYQIKKHKQILSVIEADYELVDLNIDKKWQQIEGLDND